MALFSREKYKNIIAFYLLMRPYWRNIAVFVLTGLLLTLLSLPYPWFTKILIDDVLLRQDDSLLYVIVGVTFALTVTRAFFAALRTYYVSYVTHTMASDIRLLFFAHLQKLSFSFWDGREVAEILSRFRDASSSRHILVQIINTTINNLLYLSIIPLIVFSLNWKLALIAGVSLPATILSYAILSRAVKKYARLVSEKGAELSAKNQEFLLANREVQSLGIEQHVYRRAKRYTLQFRKLDMKLKTFGNIQNFVGALTGAFGVLLYTWYGALQVITGVMTVGELTAFTSFIGYLYGPLTNLAGLMVPIQESMVYTNRFYELYDLVPEIRSPDKPRKKDTFRGDITFSGVRFGYEEGRVVLDDIDLEIQAGMNVAILGGSGSGKSTLVSLIPRFYDVSEGKILLDGIDIREIPLEYLRSKVAVVAQDPFFFVDTIYNNITGWRSSYQVEQVYEAARAANVHDCILSLPKGYDTVMGEDGATFSGGEKKRIAIARAFLLDRPLLIMDEATSSVDEKTDREIRQASAKLMEGRTTFTVSHRPTSVIDCDLILLMENGRVVEKGSHEDLLAHGGRYAHQYGMAIGMATTVQATGDCPQEMIGSFA